MSQIDYRLLAEELANFDTAGVYISDIIADPDPILKKRGDDARIFEDIMADDQVTQAVMNRKNRVLLDSNFNWSAGEPKGGKPTPEAELIKKRLCEDLERANVTEVTSAMLDAPYYGFTPIEIIWEGRSDGWRIKTLTARPNHWFRFNKDGHLCFVGEGGTAGDPVPFGKILLIRHHPKYDNPYGIRLLSRCLWPVIFKKAGVKFYAQFVEKYALPFLLAVAASGASKEEKEEAARNLASLRIGGSGVVPFGTSVQMLSAGSHHTDIHERYIAHWNASISKVIMGQTLTAELSGDTGSYAAAETHKEVGDDIAKADRAMVTQGWNELAWIYTQINAPNIAAPMFSYDTPKDLSARAVLDKQLYDIGVEFNADYIAQTYSISKEHFTMRPKPEQTSQPFMFAAPATKTNNQPNTDTTRLEEILGRNSSELAEKLSKVQDLRDVESILLEADITDAEFEQIVNAVLINGVGIGLAEGNA